MEILVISLLIASCIGVSNEDGQPKQRRTIRYWPDATIPYMIPNTYTAREKALIRVAMNRWEERTCIRFVKWDDDLLGVVGVRHYLMFYRGGRCFSGANGYGTYQPQLLGIGYRCLQIPTIVHELGHAIGFMHEMNRDDRDMYIRVLKDNVRTGSLGTYKKATDINIRYDSHGVPYDYKSVMHYGDRAYSSDDNITMVALDPAYQNIIGNSDGPSFLDSLYVYRVYSCSGRCPADGCDHGGFRAGIECRCVCVDGFVGDRCERALPGIRHVVDWRCQDKWTFSKGRCYQFFDNDVVDFVTAVKRCSNLDSRLVVYKNTEEWDWTMRKIKEMTRISGSQNFWIGLRRLPGEVPRWVYNSIFSEHQLNGQGILSVSVDMFPQCAVSDGLDVIFKTCDHSDTTGYVCVKDFDTHCGGRYTVREDPSVITSPGDETGYPSDSDCEYILKARRHTKIKLQFTKFHLLDGDTLEIRLTHFDRRNKTGIFTGDSLQNVTVISLKRTMKLIFRSDSRGVEGTGFSAEGQSTNNNSIRQSGWLRQMKRIKKKRISSHLDYIWSRLREQPLYNNI